MKARIAFRLYKVLRYACAPHGENHGAGIFRARLDIANAEMCDCESSGMQFPADVWWLVIAFQSIPDPFKRALAPSVRLFGTVFSEMAADSPVWGMKSLHSVIPALWISLVEDLRSP